MMLLPFFPEDIGLGQTTEATGPTPPVSPPHNLHKNEESTRYMQIQICVAFLLQVAINLAVEQVLLLIVVVSLHVIIFVS